MLTWVSLKKNKMTKGRIHPGGVDETRRMASVAAIFFYPGDQGLGISFNCFWNPCYVL